MNGVHQGLAGLVFLLQAVKIVAADLKGSNAPGCVFDPDAAQRSAFAQEKGSDIDIRGLVCGDRSSPPLRRRCGFCPGDVIEEKDSSVSRRGCFKPVNFALAKEWKLMGFFVSFDNKKLCNYQATY
jgi:hypothetical protein